MATNAPGSGPSVQIKLAEQRETTHYYMLISEWRQSKILINKIECKRDYFQKFGFLLIGASISIFLTAYKTNVEPKYTFYSLSVLALIIGLLLIFVDHKLAETIVYTKENALDYMNTIERKFEEEPFIPPERTKPWWQLW